MIVVLVTMTVVPAKRQELLQTLRELAAVKQQQHGFLSARTCKDADNEEVLVLVEEWNTPEDAQAYLQSDAFHVLNGALNILTGASDFQLLTAFLPEERPLKHNKKHNRYLDKINEQRLQKS